MEKREDLYRLPPKIKYNQFIPLIGQAHFALGQLNGMISQTIFIDNLKKVLITRDAFFGAISEGYPLAIDDLFIADMMLHYSSSYKTTTDVLQALKYRDALDNPNFFAKEQLPRINVLKNVHTFLLNTQNGIVNDEAGIIRSTNVLIGDAGNNTNGEILVMPDVSGLDDLLNNFDKFIASDKPNDKLVQLCVGFYQLLYLHPFLHLNERVARVFMHIYLYHKHFMLEPVLQINEFWADNKTTINEYIERVYEHDEWEEWIEYFLVGISMQSLETEVLLIDIDDLYRKCLMLLSYGNALAVLEALFTFPIIKTKYLATLLEINDAEKLQKILKPLFDNNIIEQKSLNTTRKDTIYFTSLLRLLSALDE